MEFWHARQNISVPPVDEILGKLGLHWKQAVAFPLLGIGNCFLWEWRCNAFWCFWFTRKLVIFKPNSFFLHLKSFTKHLCDTLRQRFLKVLMSATAFIFQHLSLSFETFEKYSPDTWRNFQGPSKSDVETPWCPTSLERFETPNCTFSRKPNR